MNRKQFLHLGGAVVLGAPTLLQTKSSTMKTKHNYDNAFGMARSFKEEHAYQPLVEGKIPSALEGTLYRNGPGLFERNGYRKSNILDGDGMVQAFQFRDGKVSYRNRFVRTQKWLEEEKTGKYLYNTWTTRRPGGALKNAFMQGKFGSQAGVSVRVIKGRLFAFDESSLPYELDPETLETLQGEIDFGVHFENVNTLFAAHSKVDGRTGDWIQFGLANGPKSSIQISIFTKNLQLKRKRKYQLPMGTYMHDFFVSENYIIFNLQPAEMNPLRFVMGMDSFAESLRWRGQKGSTFMILHKSLSQEPVFLKTEAVFMWHSLNAFEKKGEILCYFVGYDEPDHFIGDHAQTFEIMKPGATPHNIPHTQHPGSIRLAKINLKQKRLHMETLNQDLQHSYEFPIMNEHYSSYEHHIGYFARGKTNGAFHHQISQLNLRTGKLEYFDFGEGHYCGEPIFVAKDNTIRSTLSPLEPGWLLTLVFDEKKDKSYVALLNTEALSDGPIARIHLNHPSPMSFHGTWKAT